MEGKMTTRATRVQSQDILPMFDRALGLAYRGFQICESQQHERIIGIHLVSTMHIRERLGIAIHLPVQQNAETSQRIAKCVCTVQFNRKRRSRYALTKSLVPIYSQFKEHRTPIGNSKCMQGPHTAWVNRQRFSCLPN